VILHRYLVFIDIFSYVFCLLIICKFCETCFESDDACLIPAKWSVDIVHYRFDIKVFDVVVGNGCERILHMSA